MKRALIGNGGHAREVMAQMGEELVRFVSDEFYTEEENTLPLSKFDKNEFMALIAVGESKAREKISKTLPADTKYFTFIHPTALILSNDVIIGNGSFIGANCILTCNIKIGNHCLLNRANQIGHDCEIGDFFSMMPNSIVSGNCRIGNNVYFGTNSSVREKTIICDEVILGLNSGAIKDILDPGVYVGLPAKKLQKKIKKT